MFNGRLRDPIPCGFRAGLRMLLIGLGISWGRWDCDGRESGISGEI